MPNEICIWSQDDEDSDTWATGCGEYFVLNDGTPKENRFNYCYHCGKKLEQEIYKREED